MALKPVNDQKPELKIIKGGAGLHPIRGQKIHGADLGGEPFDGYVAKGQDLGGVLKQKGRTDVVGRLFSEKSFKAKEKELAKRVARSFEPIKYEVMADLLHAIAKKS